MAWYRCMGGNGGGGGTSDITYKIITTSADELNASIDVEQYKDDVLSDSISILYSDASSMITFHDIGISYDILHSENWSVVSLYNNIGYNGNEYAYGYEIRYWHYSDDVEFIIQKVIASGGSVSKTVLISETDFANLQTKEDDTLYEVYHNDFGTQILARYQGNKRILNYKQDISGYEFWYEDVACIEKPYNKRVNTSEIVNTGITWNEFISNDWQIEFNVTSMLNTSESAIIGSNTSGLFEIYFNSSNNLFIFGFGPDRAMTDCNGADIKITFNHTTKETNVYRNDVLIDTFTATANLSTAYVQLFDYRNNYKFLGIAKYIGFKWI